LLYTCATDSRPDRCVGDSLVAGPYAGLTCSVAQSNTNPFDASVDTTAACTIPFALVGAGTATYLDACSYPSGQPNSDPSDCVRIRPGSGRLEVRKVLSPGSDGGLFNLLINGNAVGGTVDIGNSGTSFSVGESAGTNTSLSNYSSTIVCRDLNGTGAIVGSVSGTSTNVTVSERADVVCTITNSRKTGVILFAKSVLPAGSAAPAEWNFDVAGGPQDIAHNASVTLNTGSYVVTEDGGANNANFDLTAAGGACALVNGQIQLTVTESGGTCTLTNSRKNTTLVLAKTVNSTPAIAGQVISFTITADNQGAIAANNVVVSDLTPAGLVLVEFGSSTGTCTNTGCTFASIAAGASASLFVTYTVPANYSGPASIVNVASATTDTPLVNSNLTAQATVPVIRVADLSVQKDNGVLTYTPGVATSYRITVSNSGPSDVVGASFTDALPGQISAWTWTCAAQTGGASGCTAVTNSTADFADTIDLPVGGAIVYVVNASIPSGAGDLLGNVARIAAPSGVSDPDTTNNEDIDADEPEPLADLRVTKTDNVATYTPGLPVTYEIEISNAGPSDVDTAIFNDAIPAQVASWVWTCEAQIGSASGCTPAASNATSFADTVSLPAGASIRYKVVAQTRSSATGAMSNSAQVSAPVIGEEPSVADPNPLNNTAQDIDQAAPRSTIQIGKTDGGASAYAEVPRDHIVYTIYITNTGPSDAAAITLNEVVPLYTFYDAVASSAGWSCSDDAPAGTACSLTIGPLAAGVSTSRRFGVHVASSLPAGVDQTTNTVTPTGANLVLPGPASDVTPLFADADLRLSKTDDRVNVQPGNVLTYVLTLQNKGNQDAAGVVLEDTIAANTTFVSATGGGVLAAGKVTWSIGTLAAGTEITREVVVRVASPFPPNVATITNTARVSDDGQNGDTAAGNTAIDVDNVLSAADISLTKTDNGAIGVPGQPVVYTIVTTNNGDQSTGEFIITETVPANTVFDPVNSTNGWSCKPNNNAGSVCTIRHPTLPGNGGTLIKRFVVIVDNPLPIDVTVLTNTVTVDGRPRDPMLTVTETTPVRAAPVLALTKTDDGASASPGGQILYRLTVTNNGNQNADDVVIRETVPANTTFAPGASTAGWTCLPDNSAGSTCSLNVGDIVGLGGSVSAQFAVTVDATVPAGLNEIPNQALAGAKNAPASPLAGELSPLVAAPDLRISKADGIDAARAGDALLYTLVITNTGNQGASGVVVSDTLPQQVEFVSTGNGGVHQNGVVTWQIGPLPAGASTTRTVSVRVREPLPAGTRQIVNTVRVGDDGANGADETPQNNVATDTNSVIGAIVLRLTKSDGGMSAVNPNATIVYTLTLSNIGDIGASNAVVTETVPAHTTFVPSSSAPGWSCANGGVAGSVCVLSVGELAGSGGNTTVVFGVRVNTSVPASVTRIANTVLAAATDANGQPVLAPPATVQTPLQQLILSATKAANPPNGSSVRLGEAITYTIAITNSGAVTATGVSIIDRLPAGLTYRSGSGSPAPIGLDPMTWNIGTLAPGASRTVTFVTTRTGTPLGVTVLINTAQYGSAQTAFTNTNSTAHTLAFTAVDLNALEALPSPGGGVMVKWQVSNLRNALGFHVLRGDSADVTGARRVTERMIAAQGEAYAWSDATGTAEAYYWLEEHELSGKVTVYGPTRGVRTAAVQAAPLTAFVALTPAQVEQTQLLDAAATDAQTQIKIESAQTTVAPGAPAPSVERAAQTVAVESAAAVEAPVVTNVESAPLAPESASFGPASGAVASEAAAEGRVAQAMTAESPSRAQVAAAVDTQQQRVTVAHSQRQQVLISPLMLFVAAAGLLLAILGASFGGVLLVLKRRMR
jgi:uncharacterized repeat protein (TIGR01451 family)